MKRFLTRWYLLNKRLFKKAVFVVILCIVPFLILALNVMTAQSEGFVKIAIASEDPDDPVAARLSAMLADTESEMMSFSVCDSPREAIDRVRYGEATGAWIFKSDLLNHIHELINGGTDKICVTVLEREETVALRLVRERLSAVLSSESCFELMCREYGEHISADYDAAELRRYYDEAVGTGEVFEFRYASGELIEEDDTSYLMLPIRGVLAAAILLCGLAMAMFWIRDEEQMVFCRLSRSARPAFEFGYHLTGIADVAAVVLISLYAAGMGQSFLHELASLIVYCLGCTMFVIFIRRVVRRAGSIAALTPLIIAAVIVINPILFNLPFVYPLRVLTPVHYYLQATHDSGYLWYGVLYIVVLGAVDYLLLRFTDRTKRKKQTPTAARHVSRLP